MLLRTRQTPGWAALWVSLLQGFLIASLSDEKVKSLPVLLHEKRRGATNPISLFAVSKQRLGNAAEIQAWAVLLLCVSERCPGTPALAPVGKGSCLDQGLGCPTSEAEDEVPWHAPSGFLAASLLAKPPLALPTVSFISCLSLFGCCLSFPELVGIPQGSAWVSCGAPPSE